MADDKHMSNETGEPTVRSHVASDQPLGYDDEISLEPLVRVLWSYRRVLAAAAATVAVLFALGALGLYLTQPAEQKASLEFQLLFEGATSGRYPSGQPFAISEIADDPVLTKVFAADNLGRYLPYEALKSSVTVLESPNTGLEFLLLEHRTKMARPSLRIEDRRRLEEEYRTKREALRQPRYTLHFISPAEARELSPTLLNKILNDILVVWGEDAIKRRVLDYQVEILNPETLVPDFIARDHSFVRLDVLRSRLDRILASLDDLAILPDVHSVTIAEGDARISLADVRRRLEDLLQFNLRPLMIGVLTGGVEDRQFIRGYLESRLLQSRLDRDEAAGRIRVLQDALQAYVMVDRGFDAPRARQINDPLLDRIVALSIEATDLPYRRHVADRIVAAGKDVSVLEKDRADYEELLALLGADGARNKLAAGGRIEERINAIQDDIQQTLTHVNALHAEISDRLHPGTTLYSVIGPFNVHTERVGTLRPVAAYGLLLLIVSLVVVPLACVVHHWVRHLARRQGSGRLPEPLVANGSQGIEAAPARPGMNDRP